jgi:D-3-phosphoglycerate dehydrogenase
VFLGTGVSSYVDMAEAARRGIAVRIVRNYGDRTIAEHAFGLLLAAARDFAAMDRDIRSGRWDSREGAELKDKIVGIVRVGAVGAEMVRIASAFVGMRVVAWNRSPIVPDLPCETMALYELLTIGDAVSIHLALTPKTHRFFDAARIRRFKRGVLLVNVARGALSDEAALIGACATVIFVMLRSTCLPPNHCPRAIPSLRCPTSRSRRMRPGSRGRRAFGACART